ncbi:class I SAM-dependent methyltransferase [Streptomyces sp. NPDC002476]|uniref:class I SAM-dependent methyltransferase n=1 Tax=Streptomyces sp. NPDC002476 TaxID=3364648 RepID=UPI00367432A6
MRINVPGAEARGGSGAVARRADVRAPHADPDIVARARELTGPEAPVAFTVTEAPAGMPAGPYDVITCVAALHHLPFADALAGFRERLALGGTLVVVGLAREETRGDHLLNLVSSPLNAATGWIRNKGRRAPRPVSMTAVTRPAGMTFREIVHGARDVLPGAKARRRLFWRYTLVWRDGSGGCRPRRDTPSPVRTPGRVPPP